MVVMDTSEAFVQLELQKLTNLADINKFLSKTASKERSIELELEGMLAKRLDQERRLSHLHASTREVG